jgi:hypothetical protein
MKNYYAKISLILILTLVAFSEAQAGDPPANDNFANAIPLVMGADQTVGFTTTNQDSTKEPGEPSHAENVGGASVWFKFTPGVTKVVRINTTDTTFDTLLAVYKGNGLNDLTVVGYNDNGNSNVAFGGASTADLMLTAGTTYYIAVDGVYAPGGAVEQGNFKLTLLEYDAPPQDDLSNAYYLGTGFKGGIAGTNFSGTSQPNEPIAAASTGPTRRTVWYRWVSNDDFSVAFEMTENFNAQIGIYKSDSPSPTVDQLTEVAGNVDYASFTDNRSRTIFFAQQNHTYYIQVESHNIGGGQNPVGNFQLKYGVNPLKYSASFDSYGHRSSITVFRPSEGIWYIKPTLNSVSTDTRTWGMNGDTPIAADFDGKGYSQLAAIRNENGVKYWWIATGFALYKVVAWGLPTDKPIVGDFDRDGKADLGAIRNSANGYLWYIRQSDTQSMRVFNWGTTGDKPVLGDFDGDGYTDVAVIRNTQQGLTWYILRSGFDTSQTMYSEHTIVQFGTAGDLAAAEDYDGDGRTDIAVFRPSTGTWYILRSSTGQVQITQFGGPGDKPQPGDYDGDRKADLALFRPSTGSWFFWNSGADTQHSVQWGLPTDVPVSSLSTLSQ